MSRERVDMHRLQELVRLHRMGEKCHDVARKLTMGPNTERKYRLALQAEGLLCGEPDALPSLEMLKAAVHKHHPLVAAPRQPSSVVRWQTDIETMMKRGAGPRAIYDTLRSMPDKAFDGSLDAVKRMVARLRKAQPVEEHSVVIPMQFAPGETAQVDFGYVGELFDPLRGQPRRAWVFVMVLAFSRHRFDRIVFDQKSETWLALHIEAFEFFGGVPKEIVPDNLKAAVVRAAFGIDRPDDALNRSYRELARHYGFKVDPTPPRAPAKKGRVESGVKYVKNNFFKPREFKDIDDANAQLDGWVMNTAGLRNHGTTNRKPLEMFAEESLQPLPKAPYRYIVWKKARVHRDCRFVFERRFYPVPWRFVGKTVWVRATPRSLEVYCDDVRIITHERGVPVPPEVLDRCLPEHRGALRHRGRDFWIARARAMGEEVGDYITEVFDSDDVLSMLRTVQAMVLHLEKFPPHRAQAACRRATYYGNHTWRGLRDILRKGLDHQPLPIAVAPATGRLQRPRFARSPLELLELPLELTHEPN